MSLSNPNQIKENPTTKYIEWGGSDGQFTYWDKEAGERKVMPAKFQVIILDALNTVRGYDAESNSGIYANESRTTDTVLSVRSFKGGEIAKGKWADIKPEVVSAGGKFCKAIYCALLQKGKEHEVVCLQLSGSTFGAFMDSKVKTDDGQVVEIAKNAEEQKNGAVKYFIPTFTAKGQPKQQKTLDSAIELDELLQEYLKQKLAGREEVANVATGVIGGDASIDQIEGMTFSETHEPTQADAQESELPF